MSQNGKLTPQLDKEATNLLNLTVLQRIDPNVEQILTTAAHVTFYNMDVETTTWSRKDVEGSLFVVKRKTQPRFQFIVMNRRNTENLVQDLLGGFQFEVQVPYLLYQSSVKEVTGIWFYNPHECEEIANLFNRILSAFSKASPKPKSFTPNSTDFQELERVPTMEIMEGPLESTESTPVTDAEVSEEPFEHYFEEDIEREKSRGDFWISAGQKGESLQQLIANEKVAPPSIFQESASLMTLAAPHSLPSRSLRSSSPMLLPSPPLSAPSLPMGYAGQVDLGTSHLTTLLKPSFFVPPHSSSTLIHPLNFSTPTASSLQIPSNLQPSHGEPLLQPFPPPAPSPSLTPASSMSHGPIMTRDGVHNALHRLLKNEHFIDMVYREMMNAHLS